MTTGIGDTAESMRRVSNVHRAKQVLGQLRGRLEDVRFIGWPALERSLQEELARAEAVARERGFSV